MINNPLVSICIPTFNGAVFLQEALDSVLKQTYNNLEVIISDDASKDTTLDLVHAFKKEVGCPVYIYNHKPNGIGANWNNCAKHANGQYIKFLFQDDVLAPSCVEDMIRKALKDNNIGLVYSKRDFLFDKKDKKDIEWVNSYKSLHTNWYNIKISSGRIYKGKDLLKDKNLLEIPKNKIGEPTAVLIKKEVFDKIGYFSTTLKQALDIEYWYRIMKYYNVVYIDEPLVLFRLHNNQASNINAQNKLNEIQSLEKSMYSNLFWLLHWKNKKLLFLNFHSIGKLLTRIITLFYRVKKRLILTR